MDRAVIFIGEPLVFRREGGIVRFEIQTGGEEIKFAISANNFLASNASANGVARKWRGGSCEVINTDRATG